MAERRKNTRRKARLDRPRILAAALAIVDRDGIDRLSMRSLGAALGVEAMSLYKHLSSKDAIVEGVVAAALDEIDWSVDPRMSWQGRIEMLVRDLRRLGIRHPDVFRLLARGPTLGAASLRPLEALLGALADAGLGREHAVSVMWTIVSYVLGAVTGELAETTRPRRRRKTKPNPMPNPKAGGLESFPNVAAAAALLEGCDFEEELVAGLERILAGALAERSRRRRRG